MSSGARTATGHPSLAVPGGAELVSMLRDARARLLASVSDLSDAELRVPRLDIVNPILWEIGHVAWFQEHWNLREQGRRPALLPDADRLFDSAAVAHDTRWELALPERARVLRYLEEVLEATSARLDDARRPIGDAEAYFAQLALFHEDMHVEALAYTRQTFGLPRPAGAVGGASEEPEAHDAGPLPGDVEVPGATLALGAAPTRTFVFDNEKWAHPVRVEPFRIARAAVTQAEYAEFVESGGYRRREHWSADGWAWRTAHGADGPVYWRREPGGRWLRRRYDRWAPLEEHKPVLHVSWFEADAWCRWRGRRLPTEAEWELAARGPDTAGASVSGLFPWGDSAPTPALAELGARSADVVDVAEHPAGDSAYGCRQMLGNVWEWTTSDFAPYPGFVVDPYAEYSAPWFHTRKVLRGGAFVTQPRLIRNTWRNFYTPDRRDVWAGFRTVAT